MIGTKQFLEYWNNFSQQLDCLTLLILACYEQLQERPYFLEFLGAHTRVVFYATPCRTVDKPLTQQIFIQNDMVGAIIGKEVTKINEIRQLSGRFIKINEPQDNSNERLVTITGTSDCNQMALYMLYSRLESEKHRI